MFLNLQKKRSQNLSMLETKQGQFWNLHWIPQKLWTDIFNFRIIFLMSQAQKKNDSKNTEKKNWKYLLITLFEIQFNSDSKTLLVFALSLIVFDFSFFDLKKK